LDHPAFLIACFAGAVHRHFDLISKKSDRRKRKMAYNKAKEEHKWKKWKEREEQKLRELGMDETSIQILRESDWADFNSDRRFREHQTPLLEHMEFLLEEAEVCEAHIQSIEELLDAISDEKLLHILLEADRGTLQILVMKMMGYSPKEISKQTGHPEQTVYTKFKSANKKSSRNL
jgi:RNA polymerase sigma-70 factor (ECF subfamily)